VVDKPYIEQRKLKYIKREFSADVDSDELVWHRDRKDRTVLVKQSDDWYIQMDNKMPEKLTENSEFYIPKNFYHRLIIGSNAQKNLIIYIMES